MFRYDVLREQWLIGVLFIGTALVLYVALYYYDLRKPRKLKDGVPVLHYLSTWEGIPWSIKVTAFIFSISMLIYIVNLFINPRAW
jgi:hypothetical protein